MDKLERAGFHEIRRSAFLYWAAGGIADAGKALHAFCSRHGGISGGEHATLNVSRNVGDADEHIRNNIEIIATVFSLKPEQFFFIDQIHGAGILAVTKTESVSFDANAPRPYDAVVTDAPEVVLCLKTADCVPLLFIDATRGVIGAAHAGWRGTAKGIAARTVDAMVERFSCSPDSLTAAIGPSIGPCCYEVDERVIQDWPDEPHRSLCFRPARQKGKWMLDLPLANMLQLEEKGVLPDRIAHIALCTSCNPGDFFSYRASGGKTGRQLSFIMLRGRSGDDRKFLTRRY